MSRLISLLVSIISLARSDEYYKIFSGTWPNCGNAACFSNIALSDAQAKCDSMPNCFGFSISSSARSDGTYPFGCWKVDQQCAANGMGSGPYDFYAREESIGVASSGFVQVWDNAWPNCANLECVFSGAGYKAEEFRAKCQSEAKCIGFSYSNSGNGYGCLKYDGGSCAKNGLGSGPYSYYAKAGSFCSEGCSVTDFEDFAQEAEEMVAAIPFVSSSLSSSKNANLWSNINVYHVIAFLLAAHLVYWVCTKSNKTKTPNQLSFDTESDPLLVTN